MNQSNLSSELARRENRAVCRDFFGSTISTVYLSNDEIVDERASLFGNDNNHISFVRTNRVLE
jgi:hypothetical protein